MKSIFIFAEMKVMSGESSGYARHTFFFHVRRRPLYHVVNLIVPCCLLAAIAVVTFILQPSCSERLGLSTLLLPRVLKMSPRFSPRDAMRKRGLCCRPVSVRLSVRHVGALYPHG